jgi:hypothetical protein
MADDVLSSLITAVSGLGGVYLGAWLTTRRDDARAAEQMRQNLYYMAALLGAHLDRYAAGCLTVAYDDGTSEGRPASDDGQYHRPVVPIPIFDPLALAVDWKALPPELMYAILALPARASEVNETLNDPGFEDDPPDYPAFFHTRQIGYAELGLEADGLASRLRTLVDVAPPQPPYEGWQSRELLLRERHEQLEKKEIARNKRWLRKPNLFASS